MNSPQWSILAMKLWPPMNFWLFLSNLGENGFIEGFTAQTFWGRGFLSSLLKRATRRAMGEAMLLPTNWGNGLILLLIHIQSSKVMSFHTPSTINFLHYQDYYVNGLNEGSIAQNFEGWIFIQLVSLVAICNKLGEWDDYCNSPIIIKFRVDNPLEHTTIIAIIPHSIVHFMHRFNSTFHRKRWWHMCFFNGWTQTLFNEVGYLNP